MPSLLHITADFPDHHNEHKTKAVQYLINLVPEFDHIVYSFNRLNGLKGIRVVGRENGLTTLTYRALPYGIGFENGLNPLADWIISDLTTRGINVDCIHAHKFTIDGIVGKQVADAFGCKLMCNIWGDTDQKIIRAKPWLKQRFRDVALRSSAILAGTPWAKSFVQSAVGGPDSIYQVLPPVTKIGSFFTSSPTQDHAVSVCHLSSYKRKNLIRLIQAMAIVRQSRPHAKLSIYGDGDKASIERLKTEIARHKLEETVFLAGPVRHDEVQKVLNTHSCHVLPSLRETFGMAHIEALFSGIPILYPEGQSVDGFFDDVEVGRKCDARSVESIAENICTLFENEEQLKANVTDLYYKGGLDQFTPEAIQEKYRNLVHSLCA